MNTGPTTLQNLHSRLAPRTTVSARQSRRLQGLSAEVLQREARCAALIVRRFADAVCACVSDDCAADDFLRDLDLRFITRDHDWRGIFTSLLANSSAGGAHKNVALSLYLNYLCSRQDLIRHILRQHRALDDTDDMATQYRHPGNARPGCVRLPSGSPVFVHIPYRGELIMHLGRHRFRLVDGCPPRLVDPHGRVLTLIRGRQLLGRHPSCDRVTHSECSDVSRAHMYLEWHGDSRLQITDVSSQGTFVDQSCIEDS